MYASLLERSNNVIVDFRSSQCHGQRFKERQRNEYVAHIAKAGLGCSPVLVYSWQASNAVQQNASIPNQCVLHLKGQTEKLILMSTANDLVDVRKGRDSVSAMLTIFLCFF